MEVEAQSLDDVGPLGTADLKGKSAPTAVFEPVGLSEPVKAMIEA